MAYEKTKPSFQKQLTLTSCSKLKVFTVAFTKFLSENFSHLIKWIEFNVVRCILPREYKINLEPTF